MVMGAEVGSVAHTSCVPRVGKRVVRIAMSGVAGAWRACVIAHKWQSLLSEHSGCVCVFVAAIRSKAT